jgi:hypothetical protein
MRHDMLLTLTAHTAGRVLQIALNMRMGQAAQTSAWSQGVPQEVGDRSIVLLDRLNHQSTQFNEVLPIPQTQLRERLFDYRRRQSPTR